MAFYKLENLSELHEGYQKAFSVGGVSLLLLQLDGKTHLIENRCPHMDVPLERARQLPSGRIQCLAHGIEFDLHSGRALGPLSDTLDCLRRFPLAYDGNVVGINL